MLMEHYSITDLDLITPIKKCGSTKDAKDAKDTLSYNEKSDYKNYLLGAAATLNVNSRMLEYRFNANGELETILVHSHVSLLRQLSTSDKEICEKACEVYVAIQLYIDSTYKKTQIKPNVILTDKLSKKCDFGNEESTNVVGGGSKSRRRKPVRKNTRKSKTHRRRRHSHVRKHKKYTSRRR
jgi:hypothetical protein